MRLKEGKNIVPHGTLRTLRFRSLNYIRFATNKNFKILIFLFHRVEWSEKPSHATVPLRSKETGVRTLGTQDVSFTTSIFCEWQVLRQWISFNCPFKIKREILTYLENSGCFLMTSLRVASTAAIVSSDVPTSRCGLPLGNFCTRSRMAYFPASQQVIRNIF